MFHKTRIPWILSLILVGLVASTFLSAAIRVPSIKAQAVQPSHPVENQLMPTNFSCTIAEIAIWRDRIHVRCDPGDGTINYFAAPADSGNMVNTNRYLIIINTAFAISKPVRIFYSLDTNENPPNCNPINCRLITGVMLEK